MCPQRIFGLAIVVLVTLGGRVASYTNQWAVHIEGGPEVAQQVAQEHGFQYLDKVGTLLFPFLFFPLESLIIDQTRHASLSAFQCILIKICIWNQQSQSAVCCIFELLAFRDRRFAYHGFHKLITLTIPFPQRGLFY